MFTVERHSSTFLLSSWRIPSLVQTDRFPPAFPIPGELPGFRHAEFSTSLWAGKRSSHPSYGPEGLLKGAWKKQHTLLIGLGFLLRPWARQAPRAAGQIPPRRRFFWAQEISPERPSRRWGSEPSGWPKGRGHQVRERPERGRES